MSRGDRSGRAAPSRSRRLLLLLLVVGVGIAPIASIADPGAIGTASAQSAEGTVSLNGSSATAGTSWSYGIDDLSSVSDLSATLTGKKVSEQRSRSTTTESATLDLDPRGTSAPENATMRLTGQRETTAQSQTVSDGDSISVGGNTAPESESITIEGAGGMQDQSTSGSVSGSGSASFNVGGNGPPSDATVDYTYASESSETFDETDTTAYYDDQYAFGQLGYNSASSESVSPSTTLDTVSEITLRTEHNNHDSNIDFYLEGQKIGTAYGNGGDVTFDTGGISVGSTLELSADGADTQGAGRFAASEIIARGGPGDLSVSGTTLSEGQSTTVPISRGSESISLSTDYSAGSASYSVEWTEDQRTYDPSVTLDGSTVSHTGPLAQGETETGSVDLSTGSSTVSVDSTGSIGGASVDWTEVTESQNPSIELDDGTTLAEAGTLSEGQTVEEPIDLSTGSHSATVSSDGPVKASVEWADVSETKNPSITVNGNTVDATASTLAAGETETLDLSDDLIVNGTNNVSVDLADPGGGPSPEVGVEYSHRAKTTVSTTREANTWEETVDSSRTFASDQSNVSIRSPMPENVVEIDQVSVDGATVDSSRWEMSGGDLVIDVGDRAAGETVDVFARGSKVRVIDGAIDVTNPTTEGNSLNTTVEITESTGSLRVDVNETVRSDRIHRAASTSWGDRIPVRASSDGSQKLLLGASGAPTGGSARIVESEWSADVESGDVEITPIPGEAPIREQNQSGALPRVEIGAGKTSGDVARITYHGAQTGESYELIDVQDDRVVTRAEANSPVTFEITDQSAEYQIDLAPLTSDALAIGGGGGAGGDGILPPWLLLILGVGGAIGFLGFSSERGLISRSAVTLGVGGIVVLALEIASPVSIIAELRWGLVGITSSIVGAIASTGIPVVAGGIALLVGVWYLDGRTERSIPIPIYLGAGGLAAFAVVEALAPGAITNGELAGISEIAPLLWLLLIGGGIALAWRAVGSDQTVIEVSGE